MRRGLGWQACVCLCLAVRTCPAPVHAMGLASARVPQGDCRSTLLKDSCYQKGLSQLLTEG